MPTPNVFQPKSNAIKPGFRIADIMRVKKVTGDIGIEIEVEGTNIPRPGNGVSPFGEFKSDLIPKKWWAFHHDGSLRGDENAEYVLKSPIKFDQVPAAITDLWEMFEKAGSILDESNRTSVHVHLNAQGWHLNRVCSFFALYFSVEELLTEWCGEHRVGNLFCLRAKDAPAIVTKLKQFLQSDGGTTQLSDGLHYAGLNAQALKNLGSIEIRALQGVITPEPILHWVAILERLYHLSAEYPDPRAICDGFSKTKPRSFLDRVLGTYYSQFIVENIDYTDQQIDKAMLEGIRLAQDLCYCRDWSLYEPIDLREDPFKRSSKVIANAFNELYGNAQEAAPPAPLIYATTVSESSGDDYMDDEEFEEFLDDLYGDDE